MADTGPGSSVKPSAPRVLRRRDYFLIPLVILLTASVLFATAEVGTRIVWPAYSEEGCVKWDQFHHAHPVPSCSVKEKIAEGPWLTYDFNACGYRTPDPCGPKAPGTLRVAFVGSSTTQGYHVPYPDTFAALTTHALAVSTGRTVQNENLGYEGVAPLQIYRRVPEIIALHPDIVIFTVSPFDLEEKTDPAQLAARNDPNAHFDRPAVTIHISPLKLLATKMQASRTAIIAQHYLFSNTGTYLRLSLSRGDKTDYMKAPLTQAWQDRFIDFGIILTDLSARLREVGIPLVVVSVPSHQIGALLANADRPPHTDPFEFGRELQAVVAKAGATYVDGTEAMSRTPQPDRLFYLFESHLDTAGHAVIAEALITKLRDTIVPGLATAGLH